MTLTLSILLLTGMVSYQAFKDPAFLQKLAHIPYLEKSRGQWFRMISSGLVHAGWFHLLLNMFVFYQFGTIVEDAYGTLFGADKGKLLFLSLYVLSIVAGNVPSLIEHGSNPGYRAVGASGAVSGILLISALLDPWSIWLLYFIPVPAIVAAVGFLLYSHYAARNKNDNIGHDAHFFGAIFGVLFTLMLEPRLWQLFTTRLLNEFPL